MTKNDFTNAFANLNLHPELKPISRKVVNERMQAFKEFTSKIDAKYKDEYLELEQKARMHEALAGDVEDDSFVPYHFYDSMQEIEFSYLRQHRSSSIIIAYSLLEKSMFSLCEKIQQKLSIGISVSDLGDKGITAAKKYLEKLAKIDFQSVNGQWGKLSELNILRNCLVHNEGVLDGFKGETKLRKIIEATKGLSLSPYGSIVVIEYIYIEEITNNITELLEYIIQRIDAKPRLD